MTPASCLINPSELPDTDVAHPASPASALLKQQKATWNICAKGYASLAAVQTREFDFDGFAVKVQFNPQRIISTGAKLDDQSIRQRQCFLCPANLPPQQRGILLEQDYLLLCNPFPIFPEHFTIPYLQHTPQRIVGALHALLSLAQTLQGRYTVFYNGPRCGASAPDHLHFQAGSTGFMPIDAEYEQVRQSQGLALHNSPGLKVFAVGNYLRRFISFESGDQSLLAKAFEAFYAALARHSPGPDEPMINILCSYDRGQWRLIVFPRSKQRPDCYYAQGDARMLISPASVELGGLCITPLEKDFQRITADDIARIFNEVCLGPDEFAELSSSLHDALAKRST